MSALTQNDATTEERLKAALWFSIGKTVDSITLENNINATPHFIGGLTELVHGKIAAAAIDIEAFAKHAGRTTINCEDVLLLARGNEELHDILEKKAAALRKSST